MYYFTGRRSETGNTRSHAMNANRRNLETKLTKSSCFNRWQT